MPHAATLAEREGERPLLNAVDQEPGMSNKGGCEAGGTYEFTFGLFFVLRLRARVARARGVSSLVSNPNTTLYPSRARCSPKSRNCSTLVCTVQTKPSFTKSANSEPTR